MFSLRVFSSILFYIYLTFEFQMFFYFTYMFDTLSFSYSACMKRLEFVDKFICANLSVSISHLLEALKRFVAFLERKKGILSQAA